jgi:hypothetical protein
MSQSVVGCGIPDTISAGQRRRIWEAALAIAPEPLEHRFRAPDASLPARPATLLAKTRAGIAYADWLANAAEETWPRG